VVRFENITADSNFRKTRTKDRIVSYILWKYRKRKSESNLFQIKIKNKNFGIKTDFFKQILQSTIFLFSFLKRIRRKVLVVFYVYYWGTIRRDLFRNKNKKIFSKFLKNIRYDTSFSKVRENHCISIWNIIVIFQNLIFLWQN